jgi:amidase
VGAQLLGPANSEPLLVSVAARLEAELRWFEQWPGRPDGSAAAAA